MFASRFLARAGAAAAAAGVAGASAFCSEDHIKSPALPWAHKGPFSAYDAAACVARCARARARTRWACAGAGACPPQAAAAAAQDSARAPSLQASVRDVPQHESHCVAELGGRVLHGGRGEGDGGGRGVRGRAERFRCAAAGGGRARGLRGGPGRIRDSRRAHGQARCLRVPGSSRTRCRRPTRTTSRRGW